MLRDLLVLAAGALSALSGVLTMYFLSRPKKWTGTAAVDSGEADVHGRSDDRDLKPIYLTPDEVDIVRERNSWTRQHRDKSH